MKGQFIFEFLVAGLIFFMVIVYTINYMNVNVSEFKNNFYYDRLQVKAMQVSEVLMSGSSGLGLAGNSGFNLTRIQEFDQAYCDITNYRNLVGDLHLYENTKFGAFPNDIRISITNSTGNNVLECGLNQPRNVTRAEITRFGILGSDIAKLSVSVW